MARKTIMRRLPLTTACAVLSMSLALSGCSSSAPESAPDSSSSAVVSSVETPSVETPEVTPAPVEKVKITDFYNLVNADWIAENQLDGSKAYTNKLWTASYDLTEELDALFKNATPETFDGNESMQKLLALYNQLVEDNHNSDLTLSYCKKNIDKILAVKNAKQLFQLMNEPATATANELMQIQFLESTGGDYIPTIFCQPILGLYGGLLPEEEVYFTEGITEMFQILGYSEKEASRIAENNLIVNNMILEAYRNAQEYITIAREMSKYENDPVAQAILDFLVDRNYVFKEEYLPGLESDLRNYFFIEDSLYDLIAELLKPENMQLVRDYYAVGFLLNIPMNGNADLIAATAKMYAKLFGITDIEKRLNEDLGELDFVPIQLVIGADQGVLAEYYASHYITDEDVAAVDADLKMIQDEMWGILKRIDWMDAYSLERLRVKVKKVKTYNGAFPKYNHLENYELKDNGFDSLDALYADNRYFNSLNFLGPKKDVLPDINLFTVNAYYNGDNNAIILTQGLFMANKREQAEGVPFEVRLATYGSTIAHEVGHAYDPNRVTTDSDGIYQELFTDAQWGSYYNSVNKIAEQLDGVVTDNGNAINPYSITSETFADLLSMEICLNILEKQENPDYDLFFRTFAADYASVYNPVYEAYTIRTDSHLTNKERVNFVLGQFDKFYETYDVAEDSPWYVAPEDRIRLFQ